MNLASESIFLEIIYDPNIKFRSSLFVCSMPNKEDTEGNLTGAPRKLCRVRIHIEQNKRTLGAAK